MSKDITSGGLKAIISTMKHALDKTGFLRSTNALMHMNSPGGFDCPGCAWPEPKDRSTFEFCENGAKALMNATTKRVIDKKFFADHSVKELRSWSDYRLSNCGRLTCPAVKLPHRDHFSVISYDEALTIARDHFVKLTDPDRAVFYTSGRASNEAAFIYQLFARALGTNNLCDCSNLCHESSGVALKHSIGIGKGTVQLEDFTEAQVIFLIGHNPSTNHPRMLSALRDARKNGALIVVVNPLIEPGLKRFRHPQKIEDMIGAAKEIATHYFQVKVGGDHALFAALNHMMLFDPRFSSKWDQKFIDDHTHGLKELRDSLKDTDLGGLQKNSGLSANEITTIAEIISKHQRIIYAWGMGITQTTYGVNTIESIANLALLKGQIGKKGAGLCPVRGHSNVQGNRTVGITEKPAPEFLKRQEQRFDIPMPSKHGWDVVESIHAMLDGKVDIFMSLGGNFLSASPDTERCTKALQSVELAMSLSTSLNRTHLMAGSIGMIWPTLTRVEKDVQASVNQSSSVENSMGIVHKTLGHFAPIHRDLMSEVRIIAEMAHRSVKHGNIPWRKLADNYGLIRQLIEDCVDGFDNYNERVLGGDGFLLDNPASRRVFNTKSGKAQFSGVVAAHDLDDDHHLLLTTIRSHDQFNTAIYGMDDRYRGIKGERRIVFINPTDIKRLQFADGDRVNLINRHDGVTRRAEDFTIRSYQIASGCAAAYFPETNVLVPLDQVALKSNTPTSKLVPIFLEPRTN